MTSFIFKNVLTWVVELGFDLDEEKLDKTGERTWWR